MKKILVPTDFSQEADRALKVAASLAKKNNAEIYLLHMLELPDHHIIDGAGTDVPETIFFMKLAHKRFKDITNKSYLKDVTIHETIESYEVLSGVTEAAKKYNIDLIIMGSSGATGLKEMFIGSNTEKIVRTSDVPVLVIKNDIENFNVVNFVYASDFGNDQKKAFKEAVDFAESFDAKLNLVLINTPNHFQTTAAAEKKMNDFISDFELKNYSLNIYNDNTIENGILNFSKAINADLIGMSTHGRRGLAHFFNGSISEDLVNHALRPVITFKL